jgi:DNA end-binding protein Ku
MPRAFWKGVISFGLVAIPVKMSVATETKTISFHLLHKKCLTRPKQVLHCDTDNEYFSLKDTVHGYEVAKDQYVVLEESDFKKVPIKTSHSIDILGFVEAKEIDPIYYHSSHYVEPEELGAKPFQLLLKALEKTGRVGIAKVAFQRREHLCSLRPFNDILVLQTMYFQDEIIKRDEPAGPQIKVTETELDTATSLIKAMAKQFKATDYKDEYEQALKKIIESKVKGLQIAEPEESKVEVTDLMAALRESIKAAKKEKQPAVK